MLERMRERQGTLRTGEEPAETEWTKAEGIIEEELKRRRWRLAGLQARGKGDRAKVLLAARLRAETTLTAGWIAQRLAMGTPGYLNHLLYRWRKSHRE
jgi:hypothetical protein